MRIIPLDILSRSFFDRSNAGTTSLVLLSVLERSTAPMYGYQIARLLEGNDPEVSIMKQSSLYPVLRSLEENELLASIVEPSVSGPPRRYYTITAEGRTTLKDWIEVWNQTKMFVDANLKGYSHV